VVTSARCSSWRCCLSHLWLEFPAIYMGGQPRWSNGPFVSAVKVEHVSHWRLLAKEAQFRPAKLAALCGVSERHLQRIFKERLGCPPSKWLRALQCVMARELIREGHSNKAVAAELGFLRDAHFCREFKRHFGVSPQKFAAEGVG